MKTDHALKRFSEITSQRPLSDDVKSALELMQNFTARVNLDASNEFSLTSAGFAPVKAFVKLHDSGSLHQLRGHLYRSLKWSLCKVKPRSHRFVNGIDSDGSPIVLPPVTRQSMTHKQALQVAKILTVRSKRTGLPFRYSCARSRVFQYSIDHLTGEEIPKTRRIVSGLDADGSPIFAGRGPKAHLSHSEALELAHRWNDQSKESGSLYRFTVGSNRARWGDRYKVVRYELEPHMKKQTTSEHDKYN